MSNIANPYSAAASAAGYLYQCRYALLAALGFVNRESGIELSIERFDDVAFAADGTPLEMIQTKHHIARTGDLADTSTDLWKTLRVWASAIATDPSLLRRARFVLMTTATAPVGAVASFLRPGPDRDDAAACKRLIAIAGEGRSATNTPFYAAFLDLTEVARRELVKSVLILDGSPDLVATGERISDALRMAAPADRVGDLAERLEGWWWGRACRALTRPDDAVIQVAEIEAKLDELREGFQRRSLPVDMASAHPSDAEAVAYDGRPFVRQLHFVGVRGRRLDLAKRDFYRAFEQRSRWTREKLLFDGEISAYDGRLHEEWEVRYEAMVARLDGTSDDGALSENGRQLLEWVEQSARFPLRSVVEMFLTVGSYHMLADRAKVGWHRDFERRLKTDAGPCDEGEPSDGDDVV